MALSFRDTIEERELHQDFMEFVSWHYPLEKDHLYLLHLISRFGSRGRNVAVEKILLTPLSLSYTEREIREMIFMLKHHNYVKEDIDDKGLYIFRVPFIEKIDRKIALQKQITEKYGITIRELYVLLILHERKELGLPTTRDDIDRQIGYGYSKQQIRSLREKGLISVERTKHKKWDYKLNITFMDPNSLWELVKDEFFAEEEWDEDFD
jgi:hypothetical protein